MAERPIIGVTGPSGGVPWAWWATRWQLRRAGAHARRLTAATGMPPGDIAGFVIGGGNDIDPAIYGGDVSASRSVDPLRDEFELEVLELAARRGTPVMGICRGAQLMNVWLGGTLGDFRDDNDRFAQHRNAFTDHPVRLEPDSALARIYGSTAIDEVTTWHGQHVDRPGAGVAIVGYARDGTPEAIEVDGPVFAIGVQWHAEVPPWDRRQDALFEAYAEAVRARQASTK